MKVSIFIAMILLGHDSGPKPVDEAIVSFAKANLGKKVGDGMCSSLAREAMREAGVTSRGWGNPIGSIEEARPGDILVFRDAEFAGREVHGRTVSRWSMSFPNHIAIVSKVTKRDGKLQIGLLHQNVGKKRSGNETRQVVKAWSFSAADLKSGTIAVFRPGAEQVENDEDHSPSTAQPSR